MCMALGLAEPLHHAKTKASSKKVSKARHKVKRRAGGYLSINAPQNDLDSYDTLEMDDYGSVHGAFTMNSPYDPYSQPSIYAMGQKITGADFSMRAWQPLTVLPHFKEDSRDVTWNANVKGKISGDCWVLVVIFDPNLNKPGDFTAGSAHLYRVNAH